MPTDNEFGRDRFLYVDGARYRTKLVRTIVPDDGESNSAFEARMESLAQNAQRLAKVRTVELEFERRSGSIVSCTVDISHVPYPDRVTGEDRRVAGGRREHRRAA